MPTSLQNSPVPLVRRWKVALKNADLMQGEWAKQNGWTEGHVAQVIAGRRESPVVMEKATAFIAEQERDIASRATAFAA